MSWVLPKLGQVPKTLPGSTATGASATGVIAKLNAESALAVPCGPSRLLSGVCGCSLQTDLPSGTSWLSGYALLRLYPMSKHETCCVCMQRVEKEGKGHGVLFPRTTRFWSAFQPWLIQTTLQGLQACMVEAGSRLCKLLLLLDLNPIER